MKLYVVTADTYIEDSCGSSIELFGVFAEEEKANERKIYLEKDYQYSVKIIETSLNEECEIYLGGYIE